MANHRLAEELASPEARRQFFQEEFILDATELIWDAMNARSMTKADLAKELGCTPPHVTQLLSGSRNMTLRTFADIAYVLGIRPRFHLEPEEEWEAPKKVRPCLRLIAVNKDVEHSTVGVDNGWTDLQPLAVGY